MENGKKNGFLNIFRYVGMFFFVFAFVGIANGAEGMNITGIGGEHYMIAALLSLVTVLFYNLAVEDRKYGKYYLAYAIIAIVNILFIFKHTYPTKAGLPIVKKELPTKRDIYRTLMNEAEQKLLPNSSDLKDYHFIMNEGSNAVGEIKRLGCGPKVRDMLNRINEVLKRKTKTILQCPTIVGNDNEKAGEDLAENLRNAGIIYLASINTTYPERIKLMGNAKYVFDSLDLVSKRELDTATHYKTVLPVVANITKSYNDLCSKVTNIAPEAKITCKEMVEENKSIGSLWHSISSFFKYPTEGKSVEALFFALILELIPFIICTFLIYEYRKIPPPSTGAIKITAVSPDNKPKTISK